MTDSDPRIPTAASSRWNGIGPLVFAMMLALIYFAVPYMTNWWPDSFHPLFWVGEALLVAAGIGMLMGVQVPRRWRSWRRFRVYIPREGIGYLLIMAVLFVGSSLTQSNMLLLVFAAMAGPFVVNGWLTFNMLNNLRVQRRPPARAMAGEPFSVELELENRASLISAWMLSVQDEVVRLARKQSANVLFVRVPPRHTQAGFYREQLDQRGRYELGPIRISTRFPLGLIERSLVLPAPGSLLVYPRVGRLTPQWKRDLLGAAEQVEVTHARAGVFDDEFHRLREYRTGDNPRAIHWRSSARRGTLILREYQQHREQNLLLMLDLFVNQAIPDGAARLELLLSAAATLAVEYRRECRGGTLTVVCGGRDTWRQEAAGGVAGLDLLFDRLAVAEPTNDQHFALLAREVLEQLPQGTRAMVLSLREATHAPWSRSVMLQGNGQWVTITPERYKELVLFPESRRETSA